MLANSVAPKETVRDGNVRIAPVRHSSNSHVMLGSRGPGASVLLCAEQKQAMHRHKRERTSLL